MGSNLGFWQEGTACLSGPSQVLPLSLVVEEHLVPLRKFHSTYMAKKKGKAGYTMDGRGDEFPFY